MHERQGRFHLPSRRLERSLPVTEKGDWSPTLKEEKKCGRRSAELWHACFVKKTVRRSGTHKASYAPNSKT